MLCFHPSAPQPYHFSPVYSGRRMPFSDEAVYPSLAYGPSYASYTPRVTNPEARYRRALTEYLAAEDEYKMLLYAREEAALRARAKALRQERARLLQVRQIEQALARARTQSSAFDATDGLARPHVVPVMYSPVKRRGTSLPDVVASKRPRVRASRVDWKALLESMYNSTPQTPTDEKVCGIATLSACRADVRDKVQPDHNAKEEGFSAPSLESLRECLQKTAGDEEVQDVARGILCRLGRPTSMTGVFEPSPEVSSPDVSRHFNFLKFFVTDSFVTGTGLCCTALRGCRALPL